jgi:hypothetical protein
MATIRYRVLYGSEVGGKHDTHFGIRPALVSASDTTGTDGASRPSVANIISALQNNNLHNSKSGAVTVLYSVANLDERAVAVNS